MLLCGLGSELLGPEATRKENYLVFGASKGASHTVHVRGVNLYGGCMFVYQLDAARGLVWWYSTR